MHVLISRFSALGDVAMSVPVVDSFARAYPNIKITVLGIERLKSLFKYCPSNVSYYGINLANYKGIKGIYRLYKELKPLGISHYADIHDVLRTKLLRLFFRLGGVKVCKIDKGRWDKYALTRQWNKQLKPLRSSVERYADVLRHLIGPFDVDYSGKGKFIGELPNSFPAIDTTRQLIGIAPFAKHQGKIYPIEKTEEIIAQLTTKNKYQIFLFGGGKKEQAILEAWADKYPHVFSCAGKLNMDEELILMSHLSCMLSMDSANMHLASLVGTRVISIWGATHPYAGFYGYKQSPDDICSLNLPCRPCSVYGNKTCKYGDYRCMDIKIEDVIKRV